MLAVKIDPDTAKVVGFEMATLRQYQSNPKYTSTWRFVDRSDFWSVSEIAAFMIKPSNYFYNDDVKHLVLDAT